MAFEENGSDGVVDESHGLLSLAQKIYEERVSEGEAERARLINEGETLLSQSRHKADNLVADSEREHADTLDRLRELRQVELDFRDRLFDLLDETREELDELIAEHEARINGDNVPEEVLDGYAEDYYDDDEEASETDEVWDEAEIEDEEDSDDDSTEDEDEVEDSDESSVEEFDDSDLHETVGITDENGSVVEVEDVNADSDGTDSEIPETAENFENDSDSVSEDFENEEAVSSSDEWKDDSSLSSDWEEDGDDQVSDFNSSSPRSDDRNDDVDAAAEKTWSTGEFPRVEESTEAETVMIEPIVDDGSSEEEKDDEPDKFSFFKDPAERGKIVSDDEEDDDEERASWMSS